MTTPVRIHAYSYEELSETAQARVREQMFNNVRRGEGLGYELEHLFCVSNEYPEGTPSSVIYEAILKAIGFYRTPEYVKHCEDSGYRILATKDGVLLDELAWADGYDIVE